MLHQLAEARMQVHVKGRLTRGNAGNPAPPRPGIHAGTCPWPVVNRGQCRWAVSKLAEYARRYTAGARLSTGGSADRHCTSSHHTVGPDCQREATPAGAAAARPYMPVDTRPGLLVDGSQRRQTLCQIAMVFVKNPRPGPLVDRRQRW